MALPLDVVWTMGSPLLLAASERPARRPGGDDELQMAAVTQGNRRAFSVLVERYESQLRSYCRVILQDEALGRDAVQEAFLLLWTKRDRYRPEGKFREYLFTIARNVCRSKMRRKAFSRLWDRAPVTERQAASTLVSAEPDPQAERESADCRRLMQEALLKVDAKFREALVLRYFNDLSYDEIAAIIQLTPSAARSRVFYGLKYLAQVLPEEVSP